MKVGEVLFAALITPIEHGLVWFLNNAFLFQISHRCLVNELQRFPVLRKRMDEVIGNFLREGLEPSETMIGHIIEMEVCW